MATDNNLTLDELHGAVDTTGRGQTDDEDYAVAIVDTSTWKVYRVKDIRVNHTAGQKMFSLLIDTASN